METRVIELVLSPRTKYRLSGREDVNGVQGHGIIFMEGHRFKAL